MELHLIEQLAGVMARTAIEELEYGQNGVRVRLVRGQSTAREAPALAPAAKAGAASTTPAVDAPAPSPPALYSVMAGMTGTFYGAPAPGDAPFVKVGDLVQEGQVIGVVEAMKMLNQIEAGASGRIVRILQADGTAVTPMTVLGRVNTN